MKFSEALRGAADRAPVDRVHVSTIDAVGRIKRGRALRMGANSLAGAGAVAVIAFAAVGPLGGANDEMAMADAAGRDGAAMTEESATADAPMEAMDGAAEDMGMRSEER